MATVPAGALPWESYLYNGWGEETLTGSLSSHRKELETVRHRLAKASARGGFYRTKDGSQRLRVRASGLRQDIAAMSAELRARAGDRLTIVRCSWLRAVACWQRDFLRALEWAESNRRDVEWLETAIATGRYARRDAQLPRQTLRRYARQLPDKRAYFEKTTADARALLATAPPPYAEWARRLGMNPRRGDKVIDFTEARRRKKGGGRAS